MILRPILLIILISLFGCDHFEQKQAGLNKEALAALDDKTRDPVAIQVRKVFAKDSFTLCGEVNLKGDNGSYVGFQVFVVDRNKKSSVIASPGWNTDVKYDKAIRSCANTAQKERFEKECSAAKLRFSAELDAFERETKTKQLEANIALIKALKLRNYGDR